MRVIVLEATSEAAKQKLLFKAATFSTHGYRFNRDAANER